MKHNQLVLRLLGAVLSFIVMFAVAAKGETQLIQATTPAQSLSDAMIGKWTFKWRLVNVKNWTWEIGKEKNIKQLDDGKSTVLKPDNDGWYRIEFPGVNAVTRIKLVDNDNLQCEHYTPKENYRKGLPATTIGKATRMK